MELFCNGDEEISRLPLKVKQKSQGIFLIFFFLKKKQLIAKPMYHFPDRNSLVALKWCETCKKAGKKK